MLGIAEPQALNDRVDGAFLGQLNQSLAVRRRSIARKTVGPVGDAAQLADGGFSQLFLILEKPIEDRLGDRRSKFESGKFMGAPDDPAILGFEARDAEQNPGLGWSPRACLDSAPVSRHVDDSDPNPASAGLTDGGAQA